MRIWGLGKQPICACGKYRRRCHKAPVTRRPATLLPNYPPSKKGGKWIPQGFELDIALKNREVHSSISVSLTEVHA